MNLFKKFVADESGATAIEYGLIAALMAVVVIAAIAMIGDPLKNTFSNIGTTLTTQSAPQTESIITP
ncbi:MAG TPA: Flp family type IVb pilin [Pelagibacterium sp.]|uniref:Flp family type IVb pilin n=1 Tax=Pelagibacterium sp. TaxID=1967288 RepID=UPI002C5AA1F2|nr:Flp family type IVb pilin [Pelagibacterium sp.]HWJ88790.1 Flp family type IVb pilin [Pelagibacterium sp.]